MPEFVRVPFLQQSLPFVDENRRLTPAALRALNDAFKVLGGAINEIAQIPEIQDLIVQAQIAITNLNDTTAATKAETSIVNSFVKNPVNPVSATSAGVVTIATHDRQYGDPTLNPTVSVTGGVLGPTFTAGQTVRVFYDQASRAGGAVTYQYTVDPATGPVQGGNRHSVGAVTIPATGTQTGGGVRQPGYSNPIP